MDKIWICPKCGSDNTAWLPLAYAESNYRIKNSEDDAYTVDRYYDLPDRVGRKFEHPVYQFLDAPVLNNPAEGQKVDLAPGYTSDSGCSGRIWETVGYFGCLMPIALGILSLLITYEFHVSPDTENYILEGAAVLLVVFWVWMIVHDIRRSVRWHRSNVCLNCGHIYFVGKRPLPESYGNNKTLRD